MAKNFQELRDHMSAEAKLVSIAEHRRLVDEAARHQPNASDLRQAEMVGEVQIEHDDPSN